MKRQQIIDAIRDQWIKDYGSLEDGQDRNGYFVIGFVDSVLKELEQLTKLDVVEQSEQYAFKCKVCGKPFGDKISLYNHYDDKHN
jgi:hypothetical protein